MTQSTRVHYVYPCLCACTSNILITVIIYVYLQSGVSWGQELSNVFSRFPETGLNKK